MTVEGIRIPILRMGQVLLVCIQGDLDDEVGLKLQEDLTAELSRHGARGVLIDISGIRMVDSFIGKVISDLASMSKLLDAETVVVGMQPAVAMTLVELGLEMGGVATALNVERGIELIGRSLRLAG